LLNSRFFNDFVLRLTNVNHELLCGVRDSVWLRLLDNGLNSFDFWLLLSYDFSIYVVNRNRPCVFRYLFYFLIVVGIVVDIRGPGFVPAAIVLVRHSGDKVHIVLDKPVFLHFGRRPNHSSGLLVFVFLFLLLPSYFDLLLHDHLDKLVFRVRGFLNWPELLGKGVGRLVGRLVCALAGESVHVLN
jgi:hypothetical protein